ncbi:MAG: DUF2807 domain-containing protein [Flavobacteriia bacterium]|nr:DUF2807 domain-containing protein [Flavobacteriia bacterium]
MPNILRSLALSIFTLFLGVQTAAAQKKPKIKGNRIIAPFEAPLEAFHSVVLQEDLQLNLVASDSSYVAILADDNLPPVLKFQVTDSILTLSTYYTITGAKQLDITIFTPSLQSVAMTAGEIALTLDPRFNAVSVSQSKDSQLSVAGSVSNFSLKTGDKAFASVNAVFDQLALHLQDRATATLYTEVRENAQLNLMDKAGVQWGGNAMHLAASLSANTQLSAVELQLKEAMVNAGGNAKIDLYVTDHLTYFAKGDSQLDLYGTPRVDLMEFSGTSQLRKKELK